MARTAVSATTPSASESALPWVPTRIESPAKKRPICKRPTLLWIDDYRLGLELYRVMFERLGYRVLTAASGKEGLKIVSVTHVDVVVTDYEMAGMNGEAVAVAIKSMKPELPVVLFSGSTLVPARVRRVADGFCDKAGSRNQLASTIRRVLLANRTRTLQPHAITPASDVGRRTVA